MFNLRNIKRIDEEFLRVQENNFPLFFAPIQTSKEFIFADDIKVYFYRKNIIIEEQFIKEIYNSTNEN